MKVSNQKLNSFNEKLINKINENSVTIDDVLSHKNIIYSVKRQNKKITEFLINHIDEVLKIATICDSNKSYNKTLIALQVINTTNNRNLILSICKSDFINELSNLINTMDDDLKKDAFNRFASIIETSITKFPEFINNFHFIESWLSFCDEYEVFNLFDSLISIKSDDILSFFRSIKFENVAYDLIDKWYDGNSQITTECIINIYKILFSYAKCLINDYDSIPPSLLPLGLSFFDHNNTKVLAYQWNLASVLVDKNNFKDFFTLYEKALTCIEVENHQFCEFQVNALNFITTLLKNCNDFPCKVDGEILINYISDIYQNFPESSFALFSVMSFLSEAIVRKEFQQYIFDKIFPLMISAISKQGNVTQKAFTLNFAKHLLEICKINISLTKELDKQHIFIDNFYPQILQEESLLNKDYGRLNNTIQYSDIGALQPQIFHISV